MGRITVEGFPRSGNFFCDDLLKQSFLDLEVGKFTHNCSLITDKHFILIRDPHYSISSFMNFFDETDKDASERWWLRFYNTALEKTNPERWIFFDDLTNKTEETVNQIAQLIELEPAKIDYTKLNKNATPESYPLYLFDKAQELYKTLKEKAEK